MSEEITEPSEAEKEQAQREAVVKEAVSWIRTPYHHAGKVKGVGVDCAMILKYVFMNCGLLQDFTVDHYPNDWHLHRSLERYLAVVFDNAGEVDTPKPGDVVLWKFGRCFSHGAIVVKWPLCVHAYIGRGVEFVDAEKDQMLLFVGESDNRPRERKFFSYWAKK